MISDKIISDKMVEMYLHENVCVSKFHTPIIKVLLLTSGVEVNLDENVLKLKHYLSDEEIKSELDSLIAKSCNKPYMRQKNDEESNSQLEPGQTLIDDGRYLKKAIDSLVNRCHANDDSNLDTSVPLAVSIEAMLMEYFDRMEGNDNEQIDRSG